MQNLHPEELERWLKIWMFRIKFPEERDNFHRKFCIVFEMIKVATRVEVRWHCYSKSRAQGVEVPWVPRFEIQVDKKNGPLPPKLAVPHLITIKMRSDQKSFFSWTISLSFFLHKRKKQVNLHSLENDSELFWSQCDLSKSHRAKEQTPVALSVQNKLHKFCLLWNAIWFFDLVHLGLCRTIPRSQQKVYSVPRTSFRKKDKNNETNSTWF